MKFQVKSEILGFEDIKEVELNEVDTLFSTLSCTDKDDIRFTLVKPNQLREYAFELSSGTQSLLDIQNEEDVEVYNIVLLQNPLDESKINFQAPLIFNRSNGTVAQEVLGLQNYPQFGLDESLKSFITA